MQLTGISMSNIRRIIKDFNSNIMRGQLYRNIRWRKIIISKKLKQWISKFVSYQIGWFTATDVQGQIKDRLLFQYHYIKSENTWRTAKDWATKRVIHALWISIWSESDYFGIYFECGLRRAFRNKKCWSILMKAQLRKRQ